MLLFRDVDRDNIEIVLNKKKIDYIQHQQFAESDSNKDDGMDSAGDNSFVKEDEKSDGSGLFEDAHKNDSIESD